MKQKISYNYVIMRTRNSIYSSYILLLALCLGLSSCYEWNNDLFPDLHVDIDGIQYNGGSPLVFKKEENGGFLPEYSDYITSWAIEGTLPAGLEFNESTGLISGTPTEYVGREAAEAAPVTVTAYNDCEGSCSVQVVVGVDDPPVISMNSEPVFVKWGKNKKNFSLMTEGEIEKWEVSGFPEELTFSAGMLSGKITDNEPGTYSCTVTASSSWGTESSCTFNVTIEPPFDCSGIHSMNFFNDWILRFPCPEKNSEVSDAVVYSFSLPQGLEFSSETLTGTLSGTAAVGKYEFDITGTNNQTGKSFTEKLELNVYDAEFVYVSTQESGKDYTIDVSVASGLAEYYDWSSESGTVTVTEGNCSVNGTWPSVSMAGKSDVTVTAQKDSHVLTKKQTYTVLEDGCSLTTVSGSNRFNMALNSGAHSITDDFNPEDFRIDSIEVESGAQLTAGTPVPSDELQQIISYKIANNTDLNNFASAVNGGLRKVTGIVTSDFSRDSSQTQICSSAGSPFNGTLKGSGSRKTIGEMQKALFGYIGAEGMVTNLSFSGNISGKGNKAFTALSSAGTISDCTVSGPAVSSGDSSAGGIAAENSGTISGCISYAAVTGKQNAGGIAGTNTGTINLCSCSENIESDKYAGGIAGKSSGIIDGCSATGNIIVDADQNGICGGGIAGYVSAGEIRNCWYSPTDTSTGNFNVTVKTNRSESSAAYAGGIAGLCDGAVKNCFNNGRVFSYAVNSTFLYANNAYSGGIAGKVNSGACVENCCSEGDVSSEADASIMGGGFINIIQNGHAGSCIGWNNGTCSWLYGKNGMDFDLFGSGSPTGSSCYIYNTQYKYNGNNIGNLQNDHREDMGTDVYWSWTTTEHVLPSLTKP